MVQQTPANSALSQWATTGTVTTTNGTGYITAVGPGYYSAPEPEPKFADYSKIIKQSERLKLSLKLYKEDKIDLDECIELISSDIQFAKRESVAPVWTYTSGYVTNPLGQYTTTAIAGTNTI